MPYSDFIFYVDESGDHSLTSVNPVFPVFVLAFCVFEKSTYTASVIPAIQNFKFRFFGHDVVILHNHAIRKSRDNFKFLFDRDHRSVFMTELTNMIESAEFSVIAAAIDKHKLKQRYTMPANPYDLALTFCMERAFVFLRSRKQLDHTTHFIFERRGSLEDAALELAFRRVCDGANYSNEKMPNFEIVFADKRHNSSGLQLADLVAHPIARHVLKPSQPNRAFDVVEKKFLRAGEKYTGWGLKMFP